MKRKLTRRNLIRIGLLGLIAGETAYLSQWFGGFSPLDLARWRLQALGVYLGPRPAVAITRCADYGADLQGALHHAWQLSGDSVAKVRGKRVVLKPNLVAIGSSGPATTDVRFIEAAIGLFKDLGAAEIIVAEGAAFESDSQTLLARTGVDVMLARHGVRFVDLNHDDLVETPLKGGYWSIPTLFAPKTVVDADYFVSMPKLKAHHWAGVSLSLKNLFGIVPGSRYGWPKNILHWHGIPLAILALYATFRPHLALVDGIIGMEGDGPIFGDPRRTGVVVMGTDCVAVDATCSRIMGIDPTTPDHVRLAGAWGLGSVSAERIDVRGASIADVRQLYKLPPTIANGL